MLALRFGERALRLAWRVEQTAGPIGLAQQLALLGLLAAWLPEGAGVVVLADRFYGTPGLVAACAERGWDYRLRLKVEPAEDTGCACDRRSWWTKQRPSRA